MSENKIEENVKWVNESILTIKIRSFCVSQLTGLMTVITDECERR